MAMMSADECFLKAALCRTQAYASNDRLEHVLLIEASQRWQRLGEVALADEAGATLSLVVASGGDAREGRTRPRLWRRFR
jgi:hypothetical protein